MIREESTNHGVLAHQDDALAAEGLANLVHLLRRDIVDGDDEDGLVLLQQALQLVEVAGLVSRLAPHIFFWYEGRMFKGVWFCVEETGGG
jgi:hypothetical protein